MRGKRANVDLRQGKYIVCTYSKTSTGFSVLDGTPARVPQESPAGEGETVKVTPKRNEGSRRGFTPIVEEMREFTYDSPLQLGIEVINAFDRAV